MDEQDSKVTEYLVPANVATKFEFFEGFGWWELKIVLISSLVGLAIFFALGLPKKIIKEQQSIINQQDLKVIEVEKKVPQIPGLARSFAIIIPGAGAFIIVRRNPISGMSLVTTLRSSKEFKKKQKRYMYRYNSGTEGK